MRSSIIVVVCILFAGCASNSRNQGNVEKDLRAAVDKKFAEIGRPQLGKTPEEAVRLHYKQPEMYSHGAERVLLERNGAEFERTFAIDKILVSDDGKLAVALVRYELGGLKFQKAQWLRRIGDDWLLDFVAAYGQDAIIRHNRRWIEDTEPRVRRWESESASPYDEKGG